MTVRRAALALACMLSALRTVRAEPCAPRAALSGDAAAIAKVAIELQRLGVTPEVGHAPSPLGDAHCRTIVAAVELDREGGISVAVRDGASRSEGRVVSDPALAAAWIDSWLRDDFEPAPPELPVEPARVVAEAPRAPERSLLDRFALAASFESAWSGEGARWSGYGVAACVRVGAFCIGARARYASEVVTPQMTAATRDDAQLLATASWSHDVGRMAIAPELGVGVGRMTTSRVDGCVQPPPCPDPTAPTCKLPPLPPPSCMSSEPQAAYVGDGLTSSTITPRAAALVRVAVPLFDHVWLDGTAGVILAPFGHDDYATSPNGQPAPALTIPGDPLAQWQLGVGLRVGAP